MWTLQIGATTQSLEAWGLSDPQIVEQSLSVGTFSAVLAGDQIATLPWAYLDPIILRLDDAIKFRGWAGMPTHTAGGVEESITLNFHDSWFWLTQGVYSQQHYDGVAEVAKRVARIALFAGISPGTGWTQLDASEVITEIVQACNTYHGGGKMQIGTFSGDFSVKPPVQEMQSGTFEAALRTVLNYVPDAVQKWDHSTSPPTLNFVRRGSASVVTRTHFGFTGSDASNFTPRHDQVLRGVRITYAYNDVAGVPQIAVDAAGETTGVGIAEATITLEPPIEPETIPAVVESQYLKSVSIADAGDDSDPSFGSDAAIWWAKHGGTGAAAGDISVRAGTNIAIDPAAEANQGFTGLDGCNKWLVIGTVPKWLDTAAHFRIALVTGYLSIRVNTLGGGYYRDNRIVELRLPCTDLSTGVYTNTLRAEQTISKGGTLALPEPIAAAILAARSTLHWSGTWKITGDECDFGLMLGAVLNLTGGLTAWETMNAQIQQVTHRLDEGTTEVTVGPPEHLAIQDFLATLKTLRIGAPTWLNRAAGGGPS